MTVSLVSIQSNPFFSSSSQNFRAPPDWEVTSIPIIRPFPRISFICGLLIFCMFIAGAEVFVYMRWRMKLICHLCGFDPVLYKKSPELAAKRVNEFFKEQIKNPSFMLSQSPLLALQKRIHEAEMKALEREYILKKPLTPASRPVPAAAAGSAHGTWYAGVAESWSRHPRSPSHERYGRLRNRARDP